MKCCCQRLDVEDLRLEDKDKDLWSVNKVLWSEDKEKDLWSVDKVLWSEDKD